MVEVSLRHLLHLVECLKLIKHVNLDVPILCVYLLDLLVKVLVALLVKLTFLQLIFVPLFFPDLTQLNVISQPFILVLVIDQIR